MSHNILLTGSSGYLGGTLLARLSRNDLPPFDHLYALVRTPAQAEAVKSYGAKPLSLDLSDEKAVRDVLVEKGISIVFFLIDAVKAGSQVALIKGLEGVRERTGREAHFLHTTGAKLFSSHAGAPTDRPLLDTEPELYDIQKKQKAKFAGVQEAVETNNTVIEQADAHGVKSYIFAPCIVYGKGEGFGNPISIQTVAIIKAARALRRVHSVDTGRPTWPVCHIIDNTTLYLQLLRAILANENPGSGKQGYYLASPGSVAWLDLYEAMAESLAARGVIDDETIKPANDEVLSRMGAALGSPKELVAFQLGGLCTFTAANGQKIGWKTQFSPEHILETADEEVELVLANLSKEGNL